MGFELYNLDADPSESSNLAAEQRERVQAMLQKLRDWRYSIGAQECSINEDFDSESHRRLYIDLDVSKLVPSTNFLSTNFLNTAEPLRPWRQAMDKAVVGAKPRVTDPNKEIRLQASQASVHGEKLRYEPETYKNVLGYWTNPDDWAGWNLIVPETGEYEIEIYYGCGSGNGGSKIEVLVDSESLFLKVRDTGHFQNIIGERLGTLKLSKGEHTLEVRPRSKANVAVMDIRRIVLRRMDSIDKDESSTNKK